MPTDNNLHKAAHKGDLEECKKLIETPEEGEDPIDVNEPGASDRRPLHRSAGAGHLEICEYFISKGALIDAEDNSGRTALHWASIAGNTQIVNLLLQNGANILASTKNGMNPLHGAVEGGRVETVRALMEHCNSNEELKSSLTMAKNSEEKTAWDIAAGSKNQAVCQVLKDLGDVNGVSSSCLVS